MSDIKKKYDLSFVDPHRRAEVARRIAVLERFLEAPGRRAAEAAAAELGMQASSFYDLVRAWRMKRDPAAIPGANKAGRGSLLTEDQQKIIRWANEAARNEIVSRAVDLAVAKGITKGVPMPSIVSIREYVKRLRKGQLPIGLEGVDLALDHCLLDIAVEGPDGTAVKPVVTAVIHVPKTRILGVSLSLVTPKASSAAKALVEAFTHFGGKDCPRTRLLIDRPNSPSWCELGEVLEAAGMQLAGEVLASAALDTDAGVLRKRGNGRTIIALLGRYVLGFRAQTRTGPLLHSTTAARVKTGAQPYSLSEAEDLLLERIRASTSGQPIKALPRRDGELIEQLGDLGAAII